MSLQPVDSEAERSPSGCTTAATTRLMLPRANRSRADPSEGGRIHFRMKDGPQNEPPDGAPAAFIALLPAARKLLDWLASADAAMLLSCAPTEYVALLSSARSSPASVTGVSGARIAWTAGLGGRRDSRRRLAAPTPPVLPSAEPQRSRSPEFASSGAVDARCRTPTPTPSFPRRQSS
jgi:hypothetical protein